MAGTVELLLKSTPKQSATKSVSKSTRADEAGDDFEAELGRAKNRSKSSTEDRADAAKKAGQSSSAKKTHHKGKSRQAEENDQDAIASDEPTAEKTSTPATDTAATTDDTGADSDEQVAVLDEANQAAKDKDKLTPTDPNAVAVAPPVPAQADAADVADAAETSDSETDPAAVATTSAATKADLTSTAGAKAVESSAIAGAADAAKAAGVAKSKDASDPGVSALGEESEVAIQPKVARGKSAADSDFAAATNDTTVAQTAGDPPPVDVTKPREIKSSSSDAAPSSVTPELAPKFQPPTATQVARPEQVQTPPEARFAEANHAEIVKGIQTDLMPRGGTMQIRLDPPELGALQVILTIKDGVVNATFQASSDDSSKLLSHSLGQLKTALETAGVTVDKLQVTHTPRDTQTNTGGDDQQRHQPGQDDLSRQQEQQRKEMIKRMWRKLAGESDPLDLVG